MSNLDDSIRLCIKDEADKARNQALGIFAFIGILAGIGSFIGFNALVKQAVNEKLDSTSLGEIEKANEKAQELLHSIKATKSQFEDDDLVLISKSTSAKCPENWTRWEEADGYFLRAFDPDKKLDTDKRNGRGVGSTQTDAVGKIEIKSPLNWDSKGENNGWGGAPKGNIHSSGTELHCKNCKGETRPNNISVLLCVKDKKSQ